eukprot:TRINITY_DN93445_c0_g1_i1.p1 TRINITY_DN93445_c0_g1~~TRINITY_DN93445_c0_g1_i1.p1  ORF type:complete len:172 (-),score=42.12 TRINITY_DN93445_c0_g1_i1:57-530(-)
MGAFCSRRRSEEQLPPVAPLPGEDPDDGPLSDDSCDEGRGGGKKHDGGVTPTGSLLSGTYDEDAAAADFKEAVTRWRQSRADKKASEGDVEEEDTQALDPDAPLQVGDVVDARDYEGQNWILGVVTSTEPVKVQPRGKSKSFTFEQVRRQGQGDKAT